MYCTHARIIFFNRNKMLWKNLKTVFTKGIYRLGRHQPQNTALYDAVYPVLGFVHMQE